MASNFAKSLDNLMTNQPVVDGPAGVGTVYEASWVNTIQDAVDKAQAKIGVDNSTVATSHDYKLAHKGVFASGATVFNAKLTTANVFQDLNLSSYVGANVAFVFLEVTANGEVYFAMRPKGYGGANVGVHYSASPLGAAHGYFTNGKYAYMPCFADASGIIQIGANVNTVTMTIKLVGFSRF